MISSKEFVSWLNGFVAASSKHNLSPEGWDTIRKKLAEVYDDEVLKMIKDPGTFTAPIAPHTPLRYYGDPTFPPYLIGDQPGWLTGPWTVSCTAGDISSPTFTSKQEPNE